MSLWRRLLWHPPGNMKAEKTSTKVATVGFCVLVILFAILLFATMDKGLPVTEEETAICNLRIIGSAQNAYYAKYGRYGTFPELADEGTVNVFIASAISPASSKSGYYYTLKLQGNEWSCIAMPAVWGKTGKKNFMLGNDGIVIFNRLEGSSDFSNP